MPAAWTQALGQTLQILGAYKFSKGAWAPSRTEQFLPLPPRRCCLYLIFMYSPRYPPGILVREGRVPVFWPGPITGDFSGRAALTAGIWGVPPPPSVFSSGSHMLKGQAWSGAFCFVFKTRPTWVNRAGVSGAIGEGWDPAFRLHDNRLLHAPRWAVGSGDNGCSVEVLLPPARAECILIERFLPTSLLPPSLPPHLFSLQPPSPLCATPCWGSPSL